MGMPSKYEYALYKGDTFIDLGTMNEIAQRQGIPVATLRAYSKLNNKKADKGNRLVVINIGTIEENEEE